MRVLALFIALVATNVSAQSNLPACQGSPWSNCFGTLEFPDGHKYVGEFRGGDFNGQGTYTWPSGNKYVGEWKDRKRTGQGVRTFADGQSSQEGIWENDKFVRSQRIPDHIAGRTTYMPPSVAAVPRQAEPPRSTLNPATSSSPQDTNGVEIPPTALPKSRVFVFMDTIYGALVSRYDLKFDGVELPQIYGYKYFQFDVPPGTYVINANRDGVGGTELRVTVGVNETQYVYVDPVGFPRPTPVLRLVNEARGQKGINTSTPLQVPESGLAMFINKGILVASQAIPQRISNLEEADAATLLRDDDKSIQANQTEFAKSPQIQVQAPPPRTLLNLAVTASSPDSDGVVTLNIKTNSDTTSLRINGDEVGGRADGRYSVQRFAQIGSNNFEIVATDRFGTTRKQTVAVNREIEDVTIKTRSLNPTLIAAAKPRDAVAIIIGIEKYKSAPNADFANRDASAFYDYARRALGIKPENIRLLVDDKANSVEILRSFKTWLPSRVNKNTTDVYVFYSGHGLPSEDGDSLYFLPHEVERDLLDRTAINQKEVVQTIQLASPKSVTMFIDSCYSGQTRTGTSLLASARPISIAPRATTDFPPNFMVISASAPDQISSSSPELKHGIFSYYLMLGMEGEADVNKDGQITVGEMQTYLSQQVTRRAIGMNRTQSPQTTGDLNRVLVSAQNKSR
jgi:hypothetical protein